MNVEAKTTINDLINCFDKMTKDKQIKKMIEESNNFSDVINKLIDYNKERILNLKG